VICTELSEKQVHGSFSIIHLQGKTQISSKTQTLKSHFEKPIQYIIYFELNKIKKKNTFRVVFTVLNVLPAIRHMLDKLEAI